MATVSKTFENWTTSYDPDSKQSSVRLWYMEKWTDKKGKKDSLYYTDDVLLKDGKILMYDEKIRHYPSTEATNKYTNDNPQYNNKALHVCRDLLL